MVGNAVAAALDPAAVTGHIVEGIAGIVTVTLFKSNQECISHEALESYEHMSKVSQLQLGAGSGRLFQLPWRTDAWNHGVCYDDVRAAY
jgi:hypothetical protein